MIYFFRPDRFPFPARAVVRAASHERKEGRHHAGHHHDAAGRTAPGAEPARRHLARDRRLGGHGHLPLDGGGFFLIQDIRLEQDGQPITGLEIIGRERSYGADGPSEDIKSRYYSSSGDTLDYVYELDGDTLTIWFGAKGSPAYFRGTFTPDGDAMTGRWNYPGGGGYESNMTRIG